MAKDTLPRHEPTKPHCFTCGNTGWQAGERACPDCNPDGTWRNSRPQEAASPMKTFTAFDVVMGCKHLGKSTIGACVNCIEDALRAALERAERAEAERDIIVRDAEGGYMHRKLCAERDAALAKLKTAEEALEGLSRLGPIDCPNCRHYDIKVKAALASISAETTPLRTEPDAPLLKQHPLDGTLCPDKCESWCHCKVCRGFKIGGLPYGSSCNSDGRGCPPKTDLCVCGHAKSAHIYGDGACRPGFECANGCRQYLWVSPTRSDGS